MQENYKNQSYPVLRPGAFQGIARLLLLIFTAGCLLGWTGAGVLAQEATELQQVQRQLREMQERFDRIQREQQAEIDRLKKQIESLSQGTEARAERQKLEQDLAREMAAAPDTNQASAAPQTGVVSDAKWSPAKPMTLFQAGRSYMNLSFDAIINAGGSTASNPSEYLQLGDHDPSKRGFSLRNAELTLDGAVDPYFKGAAALNLKLENDNSTEIEMEEVYFQSTSLPAGFQLKGGQFFANFGRQNSQHPHQWDFADQPIALNRAFGPDGFRNIGAQVSWLAPTPFYSEAFLTIYDGEGGTAFNFRNSGEDGTVHGRATRDPALRGAGDLVYVPRIAASWDLTEQQTLLAGASAALGPNLTGAGERSRIVGADLYWKWRPANARRGFPFVSWQTEAIYQQFEAGADAAAGLPEETLNDWGFYSQVLWGFRPRWVAGLRGEYANGDAGAYDSEDVFRGERERVSPALTYHPSEFSKIRLQYNYDRGELFGTEHSVWLQFEFLLGAHGAHRF